MDKEKVTYNELMEVRVTDSKVIVVSECSKGGYTVAQCLAPIGTEEKTYLKGAIKFDTVESIKDFAKNLKKTFK